MMLTKCRDHEIAAILAITLSKLRKPGYDRGSLLSHDLSLSVRKTKISR